MTRLTPRILRLLGGLVLYGLADSLIIRAAIGVEPWTVLAQGVSERTGWGIGILTNVIGLGVLLLWIPLRQRPGLGTLLNVLLVGTTIEFGLWLIPPVDLLWLQIVLFAAGLLLLAVASGIYIGAALGPGPRDGLMTGIHSRLGWPIWLARGLVEGSVLLVGWLLGGDVGIGTLVFALTIGPLCGITLRWFGGRERYGSMKSAPPMAPVGQTPAPTTTPPKDSDARRPALPHP
ncbi:YitT family protein [Herbiconiux sp. P17]|uniref:membrane protein YczE n=1 Tax=Herbiconiux wuyangfengii TaxID=3342794 RepID=UPI0035BADC58